MERDIEQMLANEIADEIENLSAVTKGTDEHTRAVDNLAKLYKLKIDEDKSAQEHVERVDQNTYDDQFKRATLRSEEFRQYLRLGVDAAGIILPLVFGGVWMGKGLKFEETGTFTSSTFKWLINRFRLGK